MHINRACILTTIIRDYCFRIASYRFEHPIVDMRLALQFVT